jgi:hypothetical protein
MREIAIAEAYGLALDGRSADALRVLDACDAALGRSVAVDLARARCMLCADGPSRERGDELIRLLAAEEGSARWQAGLSLARRLHRAGDTAGAARIVKSILENLRQEGPREPVDWLSTLLRLEVEHLQRPTGTRGAVSAGSLFPDEQLALIDLGRRLGGLFRGRFWRGAPRAWARGPSALRVPRARRRRRRALGYAAGRIDRSAVDIRRSRSASLIRQVRAGSDRADHARRAPALTSRPERLG